MKFLLIYVLLIFTFSKPIPFKRCDTNNPVLRKNYLEVLPDIIRPGSTLITILNETALEKVTSGQSISRIFYLNIQVGTERRDLCDNAIKGCPIEIGNFQSQTKSQVPNWSPKGTYKVISSDRDRNGRELSCIEFEFTLEY